MEHRVPTVIGLTHRQIAVDGPYVCIRPQVIVGAIEACIDDVEYALRLMHKASLARQARVGAQTPEGLLNSFRHGGGAGCSQSDGTVSEASAVHVLLYDARG